MQSVSNNNEINEISIIINKTISENIINSDYFTFISSILVNDKKSNITNYINFTKEGLNEIKIKVNLKAISIYFENTQIYLIID